MRQELIDLLLGELDASKAKALQDRIAKDPVLQRELAELESLFSLMRRGEEIAPAPALRQVLVAEAQRRTAPPLLQRLRQLPGLVRYRFQNSPAFRFAAASLCVHLIVMIVLFQMLGTRPVLGPGADAQIGVVADPDDLVHRPDAAFVMRLHQRRLPHATRLKQFGVAGQEQAIRAGLDALVERQRKDGAFGSHGETGYATLALLAEGHCSTQTTPRGRAIRAATGRLLSAVRRGARHGAVLAALVEDYALSYDDLSEEERSEYVGAIRKLIGRVGDAEIDREALALAKLANFGVPATRDLGDAAILLGGRRAALLGRQATRLSATAVLARGHLSLDRGRLREWVAPLFEAALADLESGNASALVVLTLQSPYRL